MKKIIFISSIIITSCACKKEEPIEDRPRISRAEMVTDIYADRLLLLSKAKGIQFDTARSIIVGYYEYIGNPYMLSIGASDSISSMAFGEIEKTYRVKQKDAASLIYDFTCYMDLKGE